MTITKHDLSSYSVIYSNRENCHIFALRLNNNGSIYHINCTIIKKEFEYRKFEVGFYENGSKGAIELIRRNIIYEPHRTIHLTKTVISEYFSTSIVNISYITDYGKLLIL